MKKKRILLTYIVCYLLAGGIGLITFPDYFFKLLQSNQDYGDIMPRLVGLFMVVLAGFVGMIIYNKDYKYFGFSIAARTIIVVFLFWLYTITNDPFFIVINIIVLIGLLPSYITLLLEKRGKF